ncbi:hypothetical protein jhhlp_008143 [Lomentospora prolificans]|uniref:Ketoreductase domain-containing protein n=1 Tax=Lomentospora prolificans TaxID=41688 RepID=A0A2N3MZK6_9PEZI|nr:hypothetical protein jhhlp_008143 [Lomentospora prolificans]
MAARNIIPSASFLERVFGLTGKIAVITGGSAGIGRGIAAALGQAGARVVLIARNPKPLDDTVTSLADLGVQAYSLPTDLADRAAIEKTTARILEEYGVPDILVNAAGINLRPHMDALTEADWDATIAVNLTAPFLLGQSFGPRMAERGSGRIINLASQQAFRAYGNSGAYGASKAGVVGLTRSQAEAWSSRGVLCNVLAPGVVHTQMTEAVFSSPELTKKHADRTMIGRNTTVEDFSGAAIWLAGRGSEGITGQTIFVDGGYSAT